MKKIILLLSLLLSQHAFAKFRYPYVAFAFMSPPPATVYYGETLTIPLRMDFTDLKTTMGWNFPAGSAMQAAYGKCPPIPYGVNHLGNGTCFLNIVIPGNVLGQVISGNFKFIAAGDEDGHRWGDYPFYTPYFNVTVIPHKLSMLPTPTQQATANQAFVYPIKQAVSYYDENLRANAPAQALVTPVSQDGLFYDAASFAIRGTPNRKGTYLFNIGVQNVYGKAESTTLKIEVKANPKDKPVFRQNYSMLSALPNKHYHFNLMELVQSQTSFMQTNQLHFHIQPNSSNPSWLSIAPLEPTLLTGVVPAGLAGQKVELTLVATSNTGGDSEPLKITIPVAFDPQKQPNLKAFAIQEKAGSTLHYDVTPYIDNPATTSPMLILDKVEPAAPWLHQSAQSLEGLIPADATGRLYHVTLRVSNAIGGASKPITIPLQITTDKEQIPHFINKKIQLPKLTADQSYFYDFAMEQVLPQGIPYQIEWAEDYDHPAWLNLKNNQLIAEQVPALIEGAIPIHVVLKNIPGGTSSAQLIELVKN